MSITKKYLTTTFAALLGCSVVGQSVYAMEVKHEEKSPDLIEEEIGQRVKLISKVLDEERELLIRLPEKYHESNKVYSVLYLLDGNRHFKHAGVAGQILQQEAIMPEMILVGITNNPGTRGRDLGNGKKSFLDFIQKDVFTHIAKTYRTSGQRTLFGHSMAGAFTLDVLVERPELFENYIAASPVVQMNNSELVDKYKSIKNHQKNANKSLFFSFGNEQAEGKNATQAIEQLVSVMNAKPSINLTWQYDSMPAQTHMTTPYLTLFKGLNFTHHDYQAPKYNGYADFKKRGGMKGVQGYYDARATKYNESAKIPEISMRRLGFAVFDDGHEQEGIKILRQSVEANPKSLRALSALAQSYEDVKEVSNAMKTLKRGLELSETSNAISFFKRQIERLEKENQS